MTRLNLDLSTETDERLNEIATNKGISKAEAMRRAFSLLDIAVEQEKKGNALGIISKQDNTVIARLVGV